MKLTSVGKDEIVADEEKRAIDEATVLAVGMKVQSRLGITNQYYDGVISSVDSNGKYTVLFEDGDEEKNVLRHSIRLPGQKMARVLELGESVDARCSSANGGVYSGKIKMVKESGKKYDILFDDGEKEADVGRQYIFSLHRDPPSDVS